MDKLSRIMEIIWIVLSAACLGIGIYSTIRVGFAASYMFYILALVALVMFWLRRYRRLRDQDNTKS